MLLAAPVVHAQLVADGATSTLANVTNSITGNVTVGTNGSFTLLVLADNTLLTNSAHGVIGANATARSNEVQLLAPTARWQMANNLFVGSNGALSTLIVSNGAFLSNNNGFLGNGTASSNNRALVTGTGSLWTNRLDLTVGVAGRDNQLIVSNGARVANRIGNLGQNSGSSNNLAVVTGSGSLWTNHLDVNVGAGAGGNRLVIEAGGQVSGDNGRVGSGFGGQGEALVTDSGSLWSSRTDLAVGLNPANNRLVVSNGAVVMAGQNGRVGVSTPATNNVVIITGAGSLWSNQFELYVGEGSSRNRMEVHDGGWVVSSNTHVGFGGASNLALVTGAGSVWTNRNIFTVGNSGAGNRLVVSDGGRVESSAGRIGQNVSSTTNEALVTGIGSLWRLTGALTVGSAGPGNRLVISDGALVSDTFGLLGASATGANNEAIVTGPGSVWTNVSDIRVGDLSPGNRLVISNGGVVHNNLGFVGGQPSASSNLAVVTGPGSTWNNADNLVVGSIGAGNRLEVSDGGLVQNLIGFLGANTSSSNNSAVITGPGSLWAMPNGALFIGQSASVGNRLVVSNGATVHCALGWLGFDGTVGPNEAFVTGAGSIWSNNTSLTLGRLGRRSVLVVSNDATVTAGGSVTLGDTIASANNRLVVHGGTLRATNAAGNAALIVNRGTNVLNAGLIDVDRLLLTNNTGPVVPTAYGNALAISIPSGLPATTYPVPITVLGLQRGITKVTVTISNLSHTFPDDLDILLVSPAGQKVMLMSDAGGSTDIANVRLTFDDSAGSNLPDSTAIVTGTFRPTDYVAGETMPAPAPAGPYSSTLAAFNGTNPNGTWQLYVADDTNPDSGSLSGWGLQITTDPDQGLFEFNGGTLITRGAVINNGAPFVVGRSGATPAVWDVRAGGTTFVAGDFTIGSNSPFNQLMLTNGALLTNTTSAFLGREIQASSNTVTLAGAGSRWLLDDTVIVGNWGSDNRLVVSNGAALVTGSYSSIGHESLATNNEAIVTGPGSTWISEVGQLFVGAGGRNNRLVIDDGGRVVAFAGTIGDAFANSSNNLAVVSGAGSSWSNAFELRIGDVGPANRLIVSNSGTVFAGNAVYLGFTATSTNNQLTVNDGTLRVTNASATGTLDVRRGTTTLTAGLVEVDRLLITNSQGSFQLNGGTLSTRNTTVNNGVSLHVGNNVSPATLLLAGNGLHLIQGLVVDNMATLSGNGTIIGNTVVLDGGIVSPGASIGKIVFNPAGVGPLLFGTMLMEIGKDGTTLTNDQVQVVGALLSYGGDLVVTHLGPNALAGGDKFKLFDAPFFGGSFQSISLPPLNLGLRWVNNLLVDGTIEVFASPPVGAGFALDFDGTNDFVRVSHDSRLNAYPLVATAWINTTQTNGEVGIINKYAAGSFNGWHVGLFNGEVRAWYARDNANQVGNPGGGVNGGPVSDGEWHHVAFTVDNTGASLYVDGFFKEKLGWIGTPGPVTTTQELSFGRYPGGAGEFFKGAIEEVAIWGFAEPTPGEIKTNLNRGLLGSESGLVSYHRFNEGTGSVAQNAADATGSSTVGILQNGVAWVPGLVLRPAILTRVATEVTINSAKLNGAANPGLASTAAWFEWGPTAAYGNVTSVQLLGSGGSNTNFSQTITGLTENVTYHFRAVASNFVGVSFGADRSFVATGTNLLSPRVQHTATLLPNGKVLVVGGRGQDYAPLASAELYDPASGTWAFISPMNIVRYDHTATLLPNGKVLVAGGLGPDFTPAHSTAELYDPGTGTWTLTGSMATNRAGHTATLLISGKVLVAGGLSTFSLNPTAELYDPATGSWTASGTLVSGRHYHTTSLLPNGKVLIAGGRDGNNATVSSAELYDPISATWANTGSMTTNRYGHTATLLRNGKVLVVGGRGLVNFLNSAELYDPVAGTWAATGAMLNYRFLHTATLLPDGKVFASGDGIGVPSVYNPLTGTWADVPGPDPNSGATATLLPNGNVLVAGGNGGFLTDGDPTTEAEVYGTPNNGSWAVTAPMAHARDGHTATLLPNALVLVASLTNSEIYNPITGTWSNTGALNSGRYNHTATLLPSGKVMVAGGVNFVTVPGVELYDLGSGTWSNTAPLITNRIGGHTATLLPSGKVLVVGGNGELFGPPLRNAELYDPTTGTWANTGLLTTNRSGHRATLLPNGKVLVTGGFFTGGFFPSVTPTAELYDPLTGVWRGISPMNTNRTGHISVLLPGGKVLVAGGAAASLLGETASAELFDPETETWKVTGSMILGRSGGTATLLPNGKVLVAAGYNGNAGGYLSSAEIYDPTTGKWTATASLSAAHNAHTETLLPTGRVLVTGGNFGSGTTNRAELYDVGLGFSNSWRPQITSITTTLTLGNGLAMSGAQFRGLSEASGGSAPQNSPTDYPIVQVRNLESQEIVFALPSAWSTNTFTSLPVTGISAGWAMATVFVSGIPSESRLLSLAKPQAVVLLSNLVQIFDGTAKSVSVTTLPPGLPVSVTYNGSPNAPTNVGSYPVVATILDQSYESIPAINTLTIAPVRDFGVDVSHFQNESGVPQSSWNQMFAEGKRFVFIKATEGLTGPHDPTMAINVQRASAAGLLVGVYHFAHPENRPTTNGAILEASNMVVYAGSAIGPGRLRPVLDLEFNAATLSTTALTDWAIAFCNEIIARRGPSAAPIIYCNQTFANNEFDSRLGNYDLWLRTVGTGANPAFDDPPGVGFADPTGVFNNWSFWQYSSTGSSGGLSPLDLNVCHSEFKPLESFIITNVVPTAIQLTGVTISGGNGFQFSFTNIPGALFTVLATTNVTLPLSDWTVLGTVTEGPPGQFQFSDPQATNNPQRYYRVRWP